MWRSVGQRRENGARVVEHTGLVQSLVSKHLGRLVEAGLVERRRVGRRNYHSVVDPQALNELLEVAGRLAEPARSSSLRA